MFRQSIIKSFIWKLSERLSVQIVTFVVTIILARLLLPEEYGSVALISIFIALAEVIADGGFNMALVQKKNADNLDFSTIFFFSLASSLLLYIVLYLIAPIIANFYSQPTLIKAFRVLCTSLIFYSFSSVQRAYISRYMLFNKLFISNLVSVVVSGAIGIILAICGAGIWALVIYTVLNQILSVIIQWLIVKWRPSFSFSKQRFNELFSFGWKIFCTNFIVTFFVRIRALIIGKLFSPATLAFYEKGGQFPSIISDNVCGSIQSVVFPAFSSIQDDRNKVKLLMRRTINVSCLFMFPLMVGLIVCAKPLVILLLTDKWIEVVPFMQILCLANFFRPISIPNQQAITALGYSGITLKLEILRKVIDVIILIISCILGEYAVAWGVVIFNFLCVFINLLPNVKLLDYQIHEQLFDIAPTALISIVMGIAIVWVNCMEISNLLKLLFMFSGGILVYAALCRLFKIDSYFYVRDLIASHFKTNKQNENN